MLFAGIAQSVEQLIRNQQVACSSHVSSSRKTVYHIGKRSFCCPTVAHLVNSGQQDNYQDHQGTKDKASNTTN